MLKNVFIVGSLLVALTLPAAAQIDGCYFVKYDSAVQKRHPKLEVESVSLQYAFQGSDEEDHDTLDIKLRKNSTAYGVGIECKGSDAKLRCAYTPDEAERTKFGVITLLETATGITIDFNDDIYMTSGDGDRYVLSVLANPEHRHFTLMKDKGCKHLF